MKLAQTFSKYCCTDILEKDCAVGSINVYLQTPRKLSLMIFSNYHIAMISVLTMEVSPLASEAFI